MADDPRAKWGGLRAEDPPESGGYAPGPVAEEIQVGLAWLVQGPGGGMVD